MRIHEEVMWEQITEGKYQEYIKNNKLLSKESDPILCPVCGSPLTYADGIRKCTSCEYELAVSEIDYIHRDNNICMICGNSLNNGELKICKNCQDKILKNFKSTEETK